MKFLVISDTHLEFCGVDYIEIDVDSPQNTTLILAGDINTGLSDIARTLLYYANKFANVVYVAGNHDNYNLKVGELETFVKCLDADNVFFLDKEIIEIEGVTIGGATLWGEVSKDLEYNLNDLSCIKDMTPNKFNALHQDQKAWVVENAARVDIMVTHFCPSPVLGNPNYPVTSITKYFCPEVVGLCAKLPKYWVFGHTHYSREETHNNCTFLSNQVGYPFETDVLTNQKVFEV